MKTFSSDEVLDRLKYALKIDTDSELANELGIKRATLSNWRSRNSIDLPLLFSICESINLDWLITGRGEMTKQNILADKSSIQVAAHTETRPRIPFDAAAGSLSHPVGSAMLRDCEQIPIIPNLPRYDFTIFARGDSMLPQYFSGDELACLYVKDSSFIQWGRAHVLDTAQGIVIKRIFDNGDSILCKSNNPQYHDFSIPKTEIYRIAIVVGFVRIE